MPQTMTPQTNYNEFTTLFYLDRTKRSEPTKFYIKSTSKKGTDAVTQRLSSIEPGEDDDDDDDGTISPIVSSSNPKAQPREVVVVVQLQLIAKRQLQQPNTRPKKAIYRKKLLFTYSHI